MELGYAFICCRGARVQYRAYPLTVDTHAQCIHASLYGDLCGRDAVAGVEWRGGSGNDLRLLYCWDIQVIGVVHFVEFVSRSEGHVRGKGLRGADRLLRVIHELCYEQQGPCSPLKEFSKQNSQLI